MRNHTGEDLLLCWCGRFWYFHFQLYWLHLILFIQFLMSTFALPFLLTKLPRKVKWSACLDALIVVKFCCSLLVIWWSTSLSASLNLVSGQSSLFSKSCQLWLCNVVVCEEGEKYCTQSWDSYRISYY